MKANLWSLLAVLGLGVAVGWMIKPVAPPAAAPVAASTKTPRPAEPAGTSVAAKDAEPEPKRATKTERPEGGVRIGPGMVMDDEEMPEDVKEMVDRMAKQMTEARERQASERLAVLKSRLNLTPEQEAKVKALLDQASTKPPKSGAVSFVGPGGPAMFASGGHGLDGELGEQITDLLSPEQQDEFTAFQNEQLENRMEIAASRELTRLQEQLTLTPEQKDLASAALGNVVRDEQTNPVDNPFSPEALQDAQQKRLDALRPILTPEQLDIYAASPQAPVVGFDMQVVVPAIEATGTTVVPAR